MSFDFSVLVVPNDDNDNYDYTHFLAEPIYDWLNSPEEILQVCDDIEEERKKKRKVTIIQQPQPQNTVTWKKSCIDEGHTAKRKIEIINMLVSHLALVVLFSLQHQLCVAIHSQPGYLLYTNFF